MARNWYLIIGLAKTGTTAVAMTLRNTLRIEGFCMEPKEIAAIEAEAQDRLVIKILFDHWLGRANQLQDFVRKAAEDGPLTVVIIVRDPRDAALSRLHYYAYSFFSTRPTTDDDRTAWLEIFYQKEDAPDRIGLIEMEKRIKGRFGAGFLPGARLYEPFLQFIDELIETGAATTHLLRYETYVENTIGDETLRVLLSGNRDVGPEFRRVHRSGSQGEWRQFLTEEDLAILNRMYEPFLRRFDYSLERQIVPIDPAAQNLSRKNGSEYVAKLIDEARRLYEYQQRSA
jgi:hypothetical protein